MKQRYILCLLITGALIYYGAPRMSIFAEGLQGYFAIGWLILATCVLAGNLAALLYTPKGTGKGKKLKSKPVRKVKSRSFG
ncbi:MULTISPECIES: hypothetical protein [Rossellomorea]|uniref:Uncharacterized protein n=1 Tax=Rossellomorea vietnamensis TaxID=218284 RepID=A0ACD4C5T5_9BACI|nr:MULTISPECIES: hypothetical protein [Rossellomorea]UXH43986.1 hypothetical protein N5C46_20480 [Rossellomorea vietnamensis]WGG44662.1 hypothetical protein P8596_18085 [Rossellomorea sp. DA94]WQI95348.1 hypothetical protein Q7C14_20525 [Rossellomorea vietnamensis]